MSPEIVLLNPISIILFSLTLVVLVLDFIFKKAFLKIIFGTLVVAYIVFSIIYGASYQEILITILVLLVISLFVFYRKEKKNEL